MSIASTAVDQSEKPSVMAVAIRVWRVETFWVGQDATVRLIVLINCSQESLFLRPELISLECLDQTPLSTQKTKNFSPRASKFGLPLRLLTAFLNFFNCLLIHRHRYSKKWYQWWAVYWRLFIFDTLSLEPYFPLIFCVTKFSYRKEHVFISIVLLHWPINFWHWLRQEKGRFSIHIWICVYILQESDSDEMCQFPGFRIQL